MSSVGWSVSTLPSGQKAACMGRENAGLNDEGARSTVTGMACRDPCRCTAKCHALARILLFGIGVVVCVRLRLFGNRQAKPGA